MYVEIGLNAKGGESFVFKDERSLRYRGFPRFSLYCNCTTPSAYNKVQNTAAPSAYTSMWCTCCSTFSVFQYVLNLTSGNYPLYPNSAKPMGECPRYRGNTPSMFICSISKFWQHLRSHQDGSALWSRLDFHIFGRRPLSSLCIHTGPIRICETLRNLLNMNIE